MKGFDTACAPPAFHMLVWSFYSPYHDVGIYIGGVNRNCDPNPNLTAAWVSTVATQGWGFLPLYPGLQAPCIEGNFVKMSYAPYLATLQGINEASQASQAANALGFTSGTIIYFDEETYDINNTASRQAVNSYVLGWSYELHQLGDYAGGYGNSCYSAVSDWASVSPPPDDVWMAVGNDAPSVWGLPCVSDSLWIYNQRAHQYHLNVSETYGFTILIDRDCNNIRVANFGHGTDLACNPP